MQPTTLIEATEAHLAERIAERGLAYWEEIAPACVHRGDGVLRFDPSHPAWKAAVEKYRRRPVPALPVPVSAWPRWARWLHARRRDGEVGVGDTLARVIDGRGGAAFKRWYRRLTGADCGCADRQAAMNQQYPYP